MKKYLPFLVLMTFVGNLWAENGVAFPPQKDCVAWKTKKRMFFVTTVTPVGINCNVEVSVSSGKDLHQFKITAPIAKFDSDSSQRDEEVQEILQAQIYPNIVFVSNPFNARTMWPQIQTVPQKIKGKLHIKGKSHDVVFEVQYNQQTQMVEAKWKGSYSDLQMEPPSALAGAAKVYDELELYGQFNKPQF